MSSPTETAVNQPGRDAPEGFLAPEAMLAYLQERLEAKLVDAIVAYDQLTVVISPEGWVDAVRLCKEDPGLECNFWEFLDAVDAADEGFDVNCHVYSVRHRHSVTLRCRVPGGRENPVLPSLAGVFRGANWSERETYDMFGIDFEGHPGLQPRLLTVENFEGWPLRKDFLLTSREAKPWPGAKEPGESTADEGGAADGQAPVAQEDKAAAAKAKAERAKAKAAEMRAKKAAERAAAQSEEGAGAASASDQAVASDAQQTTDDEAAAAGDAQPSGDLIADSVDEFGGGDTEDEAAAAAATAGGDPTASTPEGAAEVADSSIAKDAAAGAPQGDTAEGAPQDAPDEQADEPVENPEGEAAAAQGAPPAASGTPGIEAEGRSGGAEQQAEDDVPVVPAPGAEAAPVDSDQPTQDVDDDAAGIDRRAEDAADSGTGGEDVAQERVEEGRAPTSASERADAADRAEPDRNLASDHAADEDDSAEPGAVEDVEDGEGERP